MAKDVHVAAVPKKEPDPVLSESVQPFPKHAKQRPRAKESFEEPPLVEAVFTYIGYGLLIVLGYVSDFLRLLGLRKEGPTLKNVSVLC